MAVASLSRELEQFSLNYDYTKQKENVAAAAADACENGEPLNFSDVLEAIVSTDPKFGAMAKPHPAPYVEVSEQPVSKKFRYSCEKRSAGSITGVNSTPEHKTYPSIKIHNYTGDIRIVVSCVTKDKPYRPHPHKLIGREKGCVRGICTIDTHITDKSNEYAIKNLGIQCVKKLDIADALIERQEASVDPFKTGYDHIKNPQSIDLKAVRLCFQVFIPDESEPSERRRLCRPLAPVVTDVIYNDKSNGELNIVRSSHCSGSASGGTQVTLLCEKVTKEDSVVFYLERNNEVVWEATATTVLIHKQAAIVIDTPAFMHPDTSEHVTVMFQLKRDADNIRSNSIAFTYLPENPDIQQKRQKTVASILQMYNKDRDIKLAVQHIKTEQNDNTQLLAQYTDQWPLAETNQTDAAMPGPSQSLYLEDPMRSPYVQQPSVNPTVQPIMYSSRVAGHTLQEHNPILSELSNQQQYSPDMRPRPPNMQQHIGNIQMIPPDILAPVTQTSINMQPYPLALQPHSLNMHFTPQHMQSPCTNMQYNPSNMQRLPANMQSMIPEMQPYYPNVQLMPIKMEDMSPQDIGQTSPSIPLHHHNQNFMPLLMVQPLQETQPQQTTFTDMEIDALSSSSFSKLLQDCNDQLMHNSGMSGLSSLLDNENTATEPLIQI